MTTRFVQIKQTLAQNDESLPKNIPFRKANLAR
jgi:hypothetical protein